MSRPKLTDQRLQRNRSQEEMLAELSGEERDDPVTRAVPWKVSRSEEIEAKDKAEEAEVENDDSHGAEKKAFDDQRKKVKRRFTKLHKNEVAVNPDLDAAYRGEEAERILDYLEIESAWLAAHDGRGMAFPCIVNPDNRAVMKRGKDGQFSYGMLKPHSSDKKPTFYPLPEIFAVVHHGYQLSDPRLVGCPQIYATYKALLAVRAGAIVIPRTPLPEQLPKDILVRLTSLTEVDYIVKEVGNFWLRIDLAKHFTARGYRAAKNSVMHSRDFRPLWTPLGARELVPDEERRKAIWKLLTEYEVIEQFTNNFRTYYRIGEQDLQEKFDPTVFRKTSELRFTKSFDATRKTIARVRKG